MSTSYGLHCKSCDSDTGCGIQYYAGIPLSDLARMSPLLKQIRDMDTQGYVEISLMGWQDDGDVFLFDWLYAHAGHDMQIIDEYGRFHPLEAQKEGQ